MITIIILIVIAGLIAGYFFGSHASKEAENKVSIQNKNVSAFENITYMEGLPNSQLDILMPKHVNADDKLPVIFGRTAVALLQGISNIKTLYWRKL